MLYLWFQLSLFEVFATNNEVRKAKGGFTELAEKSSAHLFASETSLLCSHCDKGKMLQDLISRYSCGF